MAKTTHKQTLIKKFIKKHESSQNIVCVFLNGDYQQKLSTQNEALQFTRNMLTIKATSNISKPIQLFFLGTKSHQTTLNIKIEKNNQLAFMQEHTTIDNQKEIISIANLNIIQQENTTVVHSFISKKPEKTIININIKLMGKHAEYKTFGLMELNNEQQLTYQLHIDHFAPNCISNVLFKGIINDKAHGDFSCLVTAHPNVTKTQTHVINKNLLLSKHATMNSAPELEIYTDDVICSHGSTIGHLDQEAIFYLRSRGISQPKTTQILVAAFIREVIDKFVDIYQTKLIQ